MKNNSKLGIASDHGPFPTPAEDEAGTVRDRYSPLAVVEITLPGRILTRGQCSEISLGDSSHYYSGVDLAQNGLIAT